MKLSKSEKQSILTPSIQKREVGEGADKIEFFARMMTVDERVRYDEMLADDNAAAGAALKYMVTLCVVEENGAPVFDDVNELNSMAAPVFELIVRDLTEVNRSRKKSVTNSTQPESG